MKIEFRSDSLVAGWLKIRQDGSFEGQLCDEKLGLALITGSALSREILMRAKYSESGEVVLYNLKRGYGKEDDGEYHGEWGMELPSQNDSGASENTMVKEGNAHLTVSVEIWE